MANKNKVSYLMSTTGVSIISVGMYILITIYNPTIKSAQEDIFIKFLVFFFIVMVCGALPGYLLDRAQLTRSDKDKFIMEK